MTAKETNSVPVQDTSRKATNAEMDSFGYYETPLSTQESGQKSIRNGRKHEVSEENNSTSADTWRSENVSRNMTQEANIDVTSGGDCAPEDHGPRHQPYNGQGHLDFSCSSPNTNGSEDKRETFEDTGSKNKASTQVGNVQEFIRLDDKTTMSCVSENNTPIVPVSVDVDKNNFVSEVSTLSNSANELHESRQNSDLTCQPNDGRLSHHETSNMFSASNDAGQNTPNFDDGPYTTTTCGDKNTTIDQKNKTSTDHGRENKSPSYHVNEVKEDQAKASDSIGFKENISVGLQQDIDVTEDITLDEPEEDNMKAGPEESDFVPQFQGSNHHVTELSVPSHNTEVCCEPRDLKSAHDEVSTSSLAANGGDQNASKIKTDHGTNIYSYSKWGATMAESNAVDSEDQTPTNHEGGNNDSPCYEPNIKETDVKEEEKSSNGNSSMGLQKDNDQAEVNRLDDHITMIWKSENRIRAGLEENNLVQEVHRSNNSITEPTVSRHNNDEVNKSYSAAIQTGQDASNLKTVDGTIIDDYNTKAYSKLPMGGNTLETSRNEVFTKGDPSSDGFTSYIGPKDKASSRRDDTDFPFCRPNPIEADAKDEECKAFDGTILKNNVPMGLQQDSDVKKATSTFKPDNRANKESSVKKGNNLRHRGNNISKELHPEDDTSSAHGGDNKGLSCNRQPQTPTMEGSPKALNVTSCLQDENASDVSQLDDRVSLPSGSLKPKMDKRNGGGRSSKVYKICNWRKYLRNIVCLRNFCIFTIILLNVAPMAQASSSEPQWKKIVFHSMNDYLDDQSLVIASMEHSQRCSFTYTTAPHIHRECPGFIILAQNSTYIEVFTTHINETWIVEHGKGWNGKYLSATREEMLNDTAVRTIIAQYNNSANNSMERSNENSSDNNVKIIVGVVGALLGPVGLFVLFWLLYKFCNTFKRWVNQVQSSCRECFANNDNGPNPNHEDIPLAENTNGHLRNQENQPKNEETLLNGSQV